MEKGQTLKISLTMADNVSFHDGPEKTAPEPTEASTLTANTPYPPKGAPEMYNN